MAKESVRVEIFGTEYTLKSDTNEEHVKRIAQMVDEKMKKLAENSAVKSPSKLAVLTALNIADELHLLKDKYEQIIESFNVKGKELSERIDYYIDHYKQLNS